MLRWMFFLRYFLYQTTPTISAIKYGIAKRYSTPVFKPAVCVLPFLTPCSALMVHIEHCACTLRLTVNVSASINRIKIAFFFIRYKYKHKRLEGFKNYVIKKP